MNFTESIFEFDYISAIFSERIFKLGVSQVFFENP